MADLQTVSISNANLKLRWEEPYVSEGINRISSLMARGVYRGFVVAESATPDQSFQIHSGIIHSDSIALYVDRANGIGVTIKSSAPVDVDMSSRFSDGGAIPAGGETWWVWLGASYSTGVATTGSYHVTLDGVSIDDDAIILAKITMSAGATVINDSDIDRTVVTEPIPTSRESGGYFSGDQVYGMLSGKDRWLIPTLDQKDAMVNADSPSATNPFATQSNTLDKVVAELDHTEFAGLSGVSHVQLTGLYYIGKGEVSANSFFQITNRSNMFEPLQDPNSNYSAILINSVCRSDNLISVNPATDSDSNGFYVNPILRLNISYTGDLGVLALKKTTFASVDTTPASWIPLVSGINRRLSDAQISGKKHTHVTWGDTLDQKRLSSQITDIMGFINQRLKTPDPDTSYTSSGKLIWRSHNKTNNSAVDFDTVSIYMSTRGLFIIKGGYLFSDTIQSAPVDTGGGDVVIFALKENSPVFAQKRVSEGSPVSFDVGTVLNNDLSGDNVDSSIILNHIGWVMLSGAVYMYSKCTIEEELELYDKIKVTQLTSAPTYRLFAEGDPTTGDPKVRLYLGNSFSVTYNCYWDQTLNFGAGQWVPEDSSYECRKVSFANGITTQWHSYGSSFNDDSWEQTVISGGMGATKPKIYDIVSGDCQVRCDVFLNWYNTTGSSVIYRDERLCYFNGIVQEADTTECVLDAVYGFQSVDSVSIVGIGEASARVRGVSTSVGTGQSFYWYGRLTATFTDD